MRIDELPASSSGADIVVSSTNSPHHLIERAELEVVMAQREGQPLLLIDLAVPRDIDPDCREIDGSASMTSTKCRRSSSEHLGPRGRGPPGRAASSTPSWPASSAGSAAQEVVPTVAALRERADAIVEQVLAENATRWESLSTPTASA